MVESSYTEYESGIHYRIFIGFNDKKTKTQLISTTQAIEMIEATALKHFSKYTLIMTKGGFKDDSGNVYKEDGAILEVIGTDVETVAGAAKALETELNQISILVVAECVYFDFYTQYR